MRGQSAEKSGSTASPESTEPSPSRLRGWKGLYFEISALCALIAPQGILMIRLLTALLLQNFFIQVATTTLAFAQIEMALEDVIVIDPALCAFAEFTPPEPIPTICQKYAESGQSRGYLSDVGHWCVVAMEGTTEAEIREECQVTPED